MYEDIVQPKFEASDKKFYPTDYADKEAIFKLISHPKNLNTN